MKSLGEDGRMRAIGQTRADAQNVRDHSGVVGNARLTALAGAALLTLIMVELVTVPNLRALLTVHVVVGVLLAGPLAVKLGSTGYRFIRYYTRSPAYVRRGPPRLALRLLAPLLLATTLVLICSGIGLVVTGPSQAGPLVFLHGLSTLIWLPLIAIHVFAYVQRVPRLIADDARNRSAAQAPGRGMRLGVNLVALLGGAIAAIFVLPVAAPWTLWIKMAGNGPGPFLVIAGLIAIALALLAAIPLIGPGG